MKNFNQNVFSILLDSYREDYETAWSKGGWCYKYFPEYREQRKPSPLKSIAIRIFAFCDR